MAQIILRFGGTFRDARGQTGRTGAYVQLEAGTGNYNDAVNLAEDVVAAIEACSNAALIGGYGLTAQVMNPDMYGTNEAFANVEDKAVLTFLTSAYGLAKIEIPAPKSDIFLLDQETVDLAATDVAALAAAVVLVGTHGETVCNKAGANYGVLVGGARARRRFQRKTTLWTLDPTESVPEE
jgi:hypothetical protein